MLSTISFLPFHVVTMIALSSNTNSCGNGIMTIRKAHIPPRNTAPPMTWVAGRLLTNMTAAPALVSIPAEVISVLAESASACCIASYLFIVFLRSMYLVVSSMA